MKGKVKKTRGAEEVETRQSKVREGQCYTRDEDKRGEEGIKGGATFSIFHQGYPHPASFVTK